MVRIILITIWAVAAHTALELQATINVLTSLDIEETFLVIVVAVAVVQGTLDTVGVIRDAAMLGIILSLTEIGRVTYEIHGEPFNNVYQQLASTAALHGILTEDIVEIEFKNDWLYNQDVLVARSRELLRRELAKGWTYEIDMLDDPLIEVDDIIQIDGLRFYVTSISKRLARPSDGRMRLTAWRIK